jgi:hypothetical protein
MRALAVATVVLVLLLSGVPQAKTPPRRPPVPTSVDQNEPVDPLHPGNIDQREAKTKEDMERKQIQLRAVERYNSLKKDTDQLLQLATQLKTEVDKASPQLLSMGVIKKTEQIEELSKKIRKKMTTTECVSSEQICRPE